MSYSTRFTWAIRGDDMKAKSRPRKTGKSDVQTGNLVDLIDYQAGSVVSRVILKAKTGTVTLFAFDKGQGLSEHTAPFDAMVQVLGGEVEITVSGKSHRIRSGDMLVMPANEPHALKAIERFKMLLVMIMS